MELQTTQEKLESLVQGKHYLQAVRVLKTTEKILSNNDLEPIQALVNIREKIKKTKIYLQDVLTTELQNHLYLKNKSAYNRMGKPMYAVSLGNNKENE